MAPSAITDSRTLRWLPRIPSYCRSEASVRTITPKILEVNELRRAQIPSLSNVLGQVPSGVMRRTTAIKALTIAGQNLILG